MVLVGCLMLIIAKRCRAMFANLVRARVQSKLNTSGGVFLLCVLIVVFGRAYRRRRARSF